MDASLKEIVWQQFGAAIDILENAFWLDYYLSDDPKIFLPPPPFTLSEFDPDGALPDRVYSKVELLAYLEFGRQKCHDLIAGLTTANASRRFINEKTNYSIMEILLYNMRHLQHHAAQLNLLLRQGMMEPPRWVSRAKLSL